MISPGYTNCSICGLPWKYCKEKSIWTSHSGYFATCQYCWDHSDLSELKKVYKLNHGKYWRENHNSLSDILIAVEKEYNNEYIKRRKEKLNFIIHRTKNNKRKNDTLFRQN